MQSLKSIISNKLNLATDKYLTRDFQEFGLHLAEKLNDLKHKSLYIKLAKTHERTLLEEVLSFVSDSEARNRGAMFMWKLKEMKKQSARLARFDARRVGGREKLK